MPYELMKSRGKKEGYYVVNKETRKKHSKKPLSLEKAKAQMRALYASEGDEMKGGATFLEMLFGKELGFYTQKLKDETDAIVLRDMNERRELGLPNYTNQQSREIGRYYTRGARALSRVGTTRVSRPDDTGFSAEYFVDMENRRIQAKLDIIEETTLLLTAYLSTLRPEETRTIPQGAEDVITSEEIKDGDKMVDFDNEYSRGHYFLETTFNSLPNPKRNPMNRNLITRPQRYKAEVRSQAFSFRNPLGRRRPTIGTIIPRGSGKEELEGGSYWDVDDTMRRLAGPEIKNKKAKADQLESDMRDLAHYYAYRDTPKSFGYRILADDLWEYVNEGETNESHKNAQNVAGWSVVLGNRIPDIPGRKTQTIDEQYRPVQDIMIKAFVDARIPKFTRQYADGNMNRYKLGRWLGDNTKYAWYGNTLEV